MARTSDSRVATSIAVASELAALDAKVKTLLPPRYLHCYTSVSPTSMGSAGLKYGADGRVAWDRIWSTFCDLALAGGPPHRGTLLEPVSAAETAAEPALYREVVAEIGRAVYLTTGLTVVDGFEPGWIGVRCPSSVAAEWLRFAVVAENVSARKQKRVLYLPAGPRFRVEKEIKNVVVALAKGYHYWDGHLTEAQQRVGNETDWDPADAGTVTQAEYRAAVDELVTAIRHASERPTESGRYAGWVGVNCGDEETAVWLLRAVLVEEVLVRREGAFLYLPVSLTPGVVKRVARAFSESWRLWCHHRHQG